MTRAALGLALVTGLGIGRLRPAPGTLGSIPPVLVVIIVLWLLESKLSSAGCAMAVNASLLSLLVISFAVCLAAGKAAEQHFGTKDPPDVVADEMAGQAIALLLLPWRCGSWAPEPGINSSLWNLVLAGTAFAAFRFFDIAKPPPARSLQRFSGGWGILLDDLAAGVYALVVAQLMGRLFWPLVLV